MNKIAISFAVGVSALFVTAATAAPLTVNRPAAPDSDVQNVRMVCDEYGRCWRQRGERRVIVRESYGYSAPREHYPAPRLWGTWRRHRHPMLPA